MSWHHKVSSWLYFNRCGCRGQCLMLSKIIRVVLTSFAGTCLNDNVLNVFLFIVGWKENYSLVFTTLSSQISWWNESYTTARTKYVTGLHLRQVKVVTDCLNFVGLQHLQSAFMKGASKVVVALDPHVPAH